MRFLPSILAAPAAMLLGLPTLILPLHPDQALFAIAGRIISAGGFPYTNAWDTKLPGPYLLYALAIHGPFDLTHNVRLFNLLWTAVTAFFVAELGRRWWNWRAGLIAALLYALVCSTDIPWWQSAQPDSLVVLPLLVALLLYDTARGRPTYLIPVGLALGFAFELRPTTALLAPAFPLVELARVQTGSRVRLWLQRLLWMGAGFALVQAATVVYLAAGGALGEFVATLRYVGGYTRAGGPWNPAGGPTLRAYIVVLRQGFWNWANPLLVLSFPGLAAGVVGALMLGKRRVQQLLLFVVLCYAGVALQEKFFWYHYGYMVPFLSLLGGWGWDQMLAAIRQHRGLTVALLLTGLTAAVLLLGSDRVWDSGIEAWRGYLGYYRHPAERQRLLASEPGYSAEQLVANYVRDHSHPGESMYVWGFDPVLYLLAGRPTASRFLHAFGLMTRWTPHRWQAEFIEELRANRPAYIVVQHGDPGSWIVGEDLDTAGYINRFPAFQQLLASDYEHDTDLAGNTLYRRR